jgi:hypothetical protein
MLRVRWLHRRMLRFLQQYCQHRCPYLTNVSAPRLSSGCDLTGVTGSRTPVTLASRKLTSMEDDYILHEDSDEEGGFDEEGRSDGDVQELSHVNEEIESRPKRLRGPGVRGVRPGLARSVALAKVGDTGRLTSNPTLRTVDPGMDGEARLTSHRSALNSAPGEPDCEACATKLAALKKLVKLADGIRLVMCAFLIQPSIRFDSLNSWRIKSFFRRHRYTEKLPPTAFERDMTMTVR